MAGGEMSLIHKGEVGEALDDILFTTDTSKSIFVSSFKKMTNFGLQKFRIDFDGQRDLRLTEQSSFTFTIKRYADLLLDTYLMINLPNIWSPIYHPCEQTEHKWIPYEFKWIPHLGTQLIREIVITCGNYELQKYSGQYLLSHIERDLDQDQRRIYDQMTGHVSELYEPQNAMHRVDVYPNAFVTSNQAGAEPSIRGRQLAIPIGAWFTQQSNLGFPLASSANNPLKITVTLRAIQDLFTVRDVFDHTYSYPHVRPDFNQPQFAMYRFLQTPPSADLSAEYYTNRITTWNSDIHLICTQAFLSDEERLVLQTQPQGYLIKDVQEYRYLNIAGISRQKVPTNGLVASWMFFFQRNDVQLRNEWSNYTNYPYERLPSNVQLAPIQLPVAVTNTEQIPTGPYYNPDGSNTGLFITGDADPNNRAEILETFGIVINGEYRENPMQRILFDGIEKYGRIQGSSKPGLYHYHFGTHMSAQEYRPSGAINMTKFSKVELEVSTFVPQIDTTAEGKNILCGQDGLGDIAAVKDNWRLFEYNFDLTVLEERYNVVWFSSGICNLLFAK